MYLQSSLFVRLDWLDDIDFNPPINFDEYIIVLDWKGDPFIDIQINKDKAIIFNSIFQ